ncbi:hypothetical protein D3Z51_13760 [Clostridiaceae bacterium]|nr:hypothetical protein [Clostridiaceae bacterium]RKI11874.1 hypothetical protein D7V81_13190 [bacterium 1XD21-70]
MPRGVKKEIVYTGKALKLHERIQKMETELKAAKEELKIAYKEQVKAEKAAAIKEKKAAAAAAKKAMKENRSKILKAIDESGKSAEEILALLSSET